MKRTLLLITTAAALTACGSSHSTTSVHAFASKQCAKAAAAQRAWATNFANSLPNQPSQATIDQLASIAGMPITASLHGRRYTFTCR